MNPADALRAGFRLPVVRGRSVLPFYLLSGGVSAAARLPLIAGLVAAYLLLSARGRIEPLARELGRIDPGTVDPMDPTTLPPGLDEALLGLLTPGVVAVFLLSALALVVLAVVLGAVARAATAAAVYAGLRGADASVAGVDGMADYWRSFLVLLLFRLAATGLALLPFGVGLAVAGVGIGVGFGAGGSPVATALGALAAVLGGLVSLVLVLAVSLAFAFAGPAVVVDDVGARAALRGSFGFLRRRPGSVLVYVAVLFGVLVVYGSAAGAIGAAGAARVAPLFATLFVFPALDGVKTGLYADVEPAVGDARPRVGTGLRRGLTALGRFLRSHPLANLLAAALFAASIAAGYAATAAYGVRIDAPADVAGVFGTVAVGPFLNISANNWLVATTFVYGGLFAGAGPLSGIAFNGLLVGALAGIFDPIAFLALVAPHGVIELPALAVAGGLGFHLGRVGLAWMRGRRSRVSVGNELVVAFDVLVGLAVVLVVAAFVEAFLTPQVAAYVLGG